MTRRGFDSPGRVRVSLHDDFHARFCTYHLSNAEFQAYREAMDGAKYVRSLKATIATLDRVPAILVRLRKAGLGVGGDDMDARLRTALQERAATQDWLDLDAVKDRLERIEAGLQKKGERLFPYQRAGGQWLARGHGRLLADEMGLGKAQAVSEPVMTPTGWRPIGDLRVGDYVMGSDGRPTKVLGVFPQGVKTQYEVRLTDGARTRAVGDHLWSVETVNHRFRGTRGRTMTTEELQKEGLRGAPARGRKKGNLKWFVPVVAPIELEERTFVLAPYFLGALIANGCLTAHTPKVSLGGYDQAELIRLHLPSDAIMRKLASKTGSQAIEFSFTGGLADGGNLVTTYLRKYGLDHVSPQRRIPPEFLLGSISQRTDLLQGLMDNDGTVSKNGYVVEYNTTSPDLAQDVLALVRSLGGVAWMTTRIPRYVYRGKKLDGRRDYRVRMALPETISPFALPRKLKRYKPRSKYPPAHAIESIEPIGEEEAVCIRVAAADHLYVTRDCILTHNTVQALVALPASAAVVIVCPSAMKGEWKAQIARWRPSLRAEILKGRGSFRWPESGQAIILNFDILPDAHDREGEAGRACDGFLPRTPCAGCGEKKIVFAGQKPPSDAGATPPRIAHRSSCDGFAEPLPCPGCHSFLKECPRGAVILVDEAQNVKNMQAIRHRRMCALTDVVRERDGYVWFLTGTPVENEPNELWAILRAATLHEEAFGSWERFTRVFRARKLQSGGYEWGLPGEEIRAHLRRVMLRRLQRDVQSQLPPKLRKVHEVELDRATYRRVEELLAGTGKTVDEIVKLLEMDEIGFQFMSSVRAALATAKIPRLLEIAEDFEERGVPLIVFSDHRAPVAAVGQRPGWVVITGEESSEQKTRAKDDFQNGFLAGPNDRAVVDAAGVRRKADAAGNIVYPRGIGLTIKAGGTGVTLTRAAHMVFVDRAWNPQVNAQAEKRNDRIGQKATSLDIMDIVSDHPVDARVNAVIVRKMKLFEASINAAAERGSAGAEEAIMLQMREEQVAIAGGRAIRRGAKNGRERGAWEGLHTLVFDDAKDERIASEIAEQADTIGLSDKQWSLAIVITAKGRRPDEPPRVEAVAPPVVVPPTGEPERQVSLEQSSPGTGVDVPELQQVQVRAREVPTANLSPRERRKLEWRSAK